MIPEYLALPVGRYAVHHVISAVKADRFACGAERPPPNSLTPTVPAHTVPIRKRCLRLGCITRFRKADAEAKR